VADIEFGVGESGPLSKPKNLEASELNFGNVILSGSERSQSPQMFWDVCKPSHDHSDSSVLAPDFG
jgi:hypothetical protein